MCIIILGLYYISTLNYIFYLLNLIYTIIKFIQYWSFSKAVSGVEDMMWVTQAIWTLKSFTWILTTCMLGEGVGV